MKKLTLLLLSIWAVLFVVQPVFAGFVPKPQQVATGNPLAKNDKVVKMTEKIEKTVEKLSQKEGFWGKILKKHGDIKNKWLIPMVVCLIASLVLSVIPLSTFQWLSYVAYVAFVVFFILWLLALLDVM